MSTTDQISETVFQDAISRAARDVFQTMLSQTPTMSDATAAVDNDGKSIEICGQQVVGTVGFLGDLSGLIYLYFGLDFAKEIASTMLGMTQEELEEAGDEVVNDAIGELTNMTVGTFKNQLCDHGYPCKLTIPSILRGSNFTIEPISSTTRRIYRFDVGNHRLVADLLMKIGE